MKKFCSLILALLLVIASIPASVVVFGADPTYATYTALIPTTAPTIDGDGSDSAWAMADWNYVNKVLQDDDLTDANGAPGSAKFKVTHDGKYIYFYIEVEDDSFSMWDNIQIGFSDVRIDPWGNNIGPNNHITFRNSATDTFEVTNGQGVGRAESESSITVIDTKGVNTESGYRIEAKFEYAGFIYGNTNVNFQVQMEDAGRAYLLWNMNAYTLIASNTSDYGVLAFDRGTNASVPFATTVPTIDGDGSDSAWAMADWNYVNKVLQDDDPTDANGAPGSAKFKVTHDGKYIYFYIEVEDDSFSMWDNIQIGFSDVRIDPWGNNVGPNNHIAFRNSATDTFEVTNGQGVGRAESESSITVIDTKGVNTESGYRIEAKFEYAGFIYGTTNVNFQVQMEDAGRAYLLWNMNVYTLIASNTSDYGRLYFAPVVEAPEEPDVPVADYTATLTGPATDATVNDKVTFTVNVDKTFASGEVTLSYDKTLLTPVAGEGIKIGDGTVTVVVYGEDKTSIDVAFTANAAGTAAVALVEAAFSTKEEAASEDLTAAAVDTTAATVVIAPVEFAVTLPEIFEGNSAVANGGDYTFKAKDTNNYNYALPTATVGGEAVTVIDNGDGTYTVSNVTGVLVITGTRTEKTYNATVTGNGAEDVTLPEAKPTYGTDYVLTLPVTNENYTYTVTVQVGNGEPIPVTSNTYTVAGADIIGDIVVNVTKTEIVPETVTVTLAGNANDAVVNFVGTVNQGDAYTLTINPVKGYTYTVTATMGGETVTLDTSVANAYTVAAATADIEFTVTATLDKSGVSVNTYVQLDGTTMWLVTVDTELADGKTYTYGGNTMYYSEAYGAYVYLVVANELTVDAAKAAVDATTGTAASFATDVAYDVNKSGKLDANDAQLVYNMYNAVYSDFTADVTLEKFLLADANADGMLNTEDAATIVSEILK